MTLALAKKQIIKTAVLVVSTKALLILILMKRISNFGWLKFCNSINFCNKLVLRVCKKYNLVTPEIFVPKKNIISNIVNKRVKFIGYKIYSKYFKLYVITNRLVSVTSKSKLLLDFLIRTIINTYIIITFNKNYYIYEI